MLPLELPVRRSVHGDSAHALRGDVLSQSAPTRGTRTRRRPDSPGSNTSKCTSAWPWNHGERDVTVYRDNYSWTFALSVLTLKGHFWCNAVNDCRAQSQFDVNQQLHWKTIQARIELAMMSPYAWYHVDKWELAVILGHHQNIRFDLWLWLFLWPASVGELRCSDRI